MDAESRAWNKNQEHHDSKVQAEDSRSTEAVVNTTFSLQVSENFLERGNKGAFRLWSTY